MRTLFIFLFLCAGAVTQIYALPVIGQKNYRWRNDDGNETAATWRAAVNTPITVTSVSDVVRVRMELSNTGTVAGTVAETLEYSSNGGTTWTTMSNPATDAFIYQTSTFVTNGMATTSQLVTTTPGTSAAGRVVTAPGTAQNLAANAKTEYEWVIKPTVNAVSGVTYTFRSSGQSAVVTVFPTMTMNISSCSGTPSAGTTAAAAATVACNATTALSLTGSTSGPGLSYQWQYNTSGTWVNFGTNAATQTSPAITQSTRFRCNVTCTSAGGGTAGSVPVTVNVTPLPVNIGNDTAICPVSTLTLNAGNAGATYAWNTGATSQSLNVNTPGTYAVLVTQPGGCSGSDTITVAPGVVPVNVLPTTTDLCQGTSATLNAGNTGSTFSWTPGGATTQTINVTAAGTYSARIKSVNGCVISSSTNVIIRPLAVLDLGDDTAICKGDTIWLDAGNPGYTFAWSTGAVTQTIPASDSGTYTATVTTPYNCVTIDSRHVAYRPPPVAEGFNFIPLFYENLGKVKFTALDPQHVQAYEWDFGDGSSKSTEANPIHVYAATGSYNVKLKVFNNCGSDSVSLPISVNLVTGVVGPEQAPADVVLYPNPSKDYIIIDNKSGRIKMEQITVFNTLGTVVCRQKITDGRKYQLPVSRLATGMYTIRIQTDKGFVMRKFEVLR